MATMAIRQPFIGMGAGGCFEGEINLSMCSRWLGHLLGLYSVFFRRLLEIRQKSVGRLPYGPSSVEPHRLLQGYHDVNTMEHVPVMGLMLKIRGIYVKDTPFFTQDEFFHNLCFGNDTRRLGIDEWRVTTAFDVWCFRQDYHGHLSFCFASDDRRFPGHQIHQIPGAKWAEQAAERRKTAVAPLTNYVTRTKGERMLVSASRGGVLTLFKAVQWVRSEGIGSTGGSRTAFRSSGSEKASARVFIIPGIASATAFIPGTASKGFLPSLPGIIDIRLVIQTTTKSIRICPTTLRFTHGISFKYTGTSFTLLSTFVDEKDFDGLAPP
ncbi:hypothetical protein JOM56_010944 [Amanita muscaria]